MGEQTCFKLNLTSYRPLNDSLSSMRADVLKTEYVRTDTNIVGKKNLDRVNKERKDLGCLQNK